MRLRVWLRAARLPFLTGAGVPVLVGTVAAWHDTGDFAWTRFSLTMVGALLVHAGANLTNDYFDHVSGGDPANPAPTPFSGGSRVIQEELVTARQVLGVSLALLFVGGCLGLWLNFVSRGNVILLLGVIGFFLGFFYSSGPLRLGYRGLGEVAVGICFGPVIVLGAYYVQTQALSMSAGLASIPLGILIALVLLINGFPDRDADAAVGKRTLVVILGKRGAAALYRVLLACVYVSTLALVALRTLPQQCLVVLFTLPLARRAWMISARKFDSGSELLPANASTIALHALVGVGLCLGLAADKLF